MTTIKLAHFYTTPDVQSEADFVGDSLDLSQKAKDSNADKIVFAGVRFMAETAKLLCPDAKVYLPDSNSTCSLVEQTDISALRLWRQSYPEHVHVAYINSSIEHKAEADMIVTSRIVVDVIKQYYDAGKKVIFSPDRNMGTYINQEFGFDMPLWSAVCDVHEKFNELELAKMISNYFSMGITPVVIAHPESPMNILDFAVYIGSTSGMLDFVENYPMDKSAIIVATEDGILHNMRTLRPDLTIIQAPTYKGCQCNSCPFMKMNSLDNFNDSGEEIFISDELAERAIIPVNKMIEFNQTSKISL